MDTSLPPDEPRTRTGASGAKQASGAAEAPAEAPAEGAILGGRFRVGKPLGEGGMGAVYEAQHLHTGATLALKLLLPGAAGGASREERLLREARAAGRLRSPGVVRVLDAGRLDDGRAYLAMERLRGESLRQRLDRDRTLEVSLATAIVLQVCEALAEAHQAGVIHRDLKPSNLFLVEGGALAVKILDFGISKNLSEAGPSTSTGEVFGSPGYMSPEQLRGTREADGRSDLWSLGVVFYEMLAGKLPFVAASAAGMALAIGADPPAPLRAARPDVPPSIEAAITRCLEKAPERRFQGADELAAALRQGTRPPRRLLPWLVAPAALAVGAWSLWPAPSPRAPLPPGPPVEITPDSAAEAPGAAPQPSSAVAGAEPAAINTEAPPAPAPSEKSQAPQAATKAKKTPPVAPPSSAAPPAQPAASAPRPTREEYPSTRR